MVIHGYDDKINYLEVFAVRDVSPLRTRKTFAFEFRYVSSARFNKQIVLILKTGGYFNSDGLDLLAKSAYPPMDTKEERSIVE